MKLFYRIILGILPIYFLVFFAPQAMAWGTDFTPPIITIDSVTPQPPCSTSGSQTTGCTGSVTLNASCADNGPGSNGIESGCTITSVNQTTSGAQGTVTIFNNGTQVTITNITSDTWIRITAEDGMLIETTKSHFVYFAGTTPPPTPTNTPPPATLTPTPTTAPIPQDFAIDAFQSCSGLIPGSVDVILTITKSDNADYYITTRNSSTIERFDADSPQQPAQYNRSGGEGLPMNTIYDFYASAFNDFGSKVAFPAPKRITTRSDCGGGPTNTPTPTNTPFPTATAIPTPSPTNTPPPGATFTPPPTPTPQPIGGFSVSGFPTACPGPNFSITITFTAPAGGEPSGTTYTISRDGNPANVVATFSGFGDPQYWWTDPIPYPQSASHTYRVLASAPGYQSIVAFPSPFTGSTEWLTVATPTCAGPTPTNTPIPTATAIPTATLTPPPGATNTPTPTPAAPQGFGASVRADCITPGDPSSMVNVTLTWNNAQGATTYDTFRNGSPWFTNITASGGQETVTDGFIPQNTSVTYRVLAKNSTGSIYSFPDPLPINTGTCSGPTTTPTLTPTPTSSGTLPGDFALSDLQFCSGSSAVVQLNWGGGATGAEYYQVWRNGLLLAPHLDPTTPPQQNTYSDFGPQQGANYTYFVRAINSFGSKDSTPNPLSVTINSCGSGTPFTLIAQVKYQTGTQNNGTPIYSLWSGNTSTFYLGVSGQPCPSGIADPNYRGQLSSSTGAATTSIPYSNGFPQYAVCYVSLPTSQGYVAQSPVGTPPQQTVTFNSTDPTQPVTVTFTIKPGTGGNPWWQTPGGDTRFDNGIDNTSEPIPSTATAACGGAYATKDQLPTALAPGVIFSGDNSHSFGQGQASPVVPTYGGNWTVGGTGTLADIFNPSVIPTSYSSLMSIAQQNNITPAQLSTVCTTSACTLTNPASGSVHIFQNTGDVTLNASSFVDDY